MTLVIMIFFWAALLYLEIYLAARENKWLGLLIPGASLLLSFWPAVTMYRLLIGMPEAQPLFIESMVTLTFLFSNIPTLVYLVLYILGRLKVRKKNQLRKMDIQDLD